jgi:hypothetical protein
MGHSKSSPKRKVYNHECLYLKDRKTQINNLMTHLKLLENQEQAKPKRSRRRDYKAYDII